MYGLEFLSSINESADGIQCILKVIISTNPGLVNHEDPPDVAATKKEEVIEEAVQNDNKDQLINTDTTTICLCLTRTIKTF